MRKIIYYYNPIELLDAGLEMLFNSFQFVIFFLIVYSLYLLFPRLKVQNSILLVASYVFYAAWDWRFLLLIWGSTLVDFIIGKNIAAGEDEDSKDRRKRILLFSFSLLFNLGLLGVFKYYNFFDASLVKLLRTFGLNAQLHTLNVILPIGISFYTFQTLSYTIDIFRGRMQPTNSLLNFATFVAFFPQLVAGPIERAFNFLPQIELPRRITSAQVESGIALILFGYFKKLVIADNLGLITNQIFNNYTNYSGMDVILAALAFSFQVYGDFSGYSDIARGIARLMGFELMLNFSLPYFALNPPEFWQRWHISLSSWFRDYVFFPLRRIMIKNLSGRNYPLTNLGVFIIPTFVTMGLSGLWHGARWNFVIWGLYHGFLLIAYYMIDRYIAPYIKGRWQINEQLLAVPKMVLMFSLVVVGWIMFRAETTVQIRYMLGSLSFIPSLESIGFIERIVFLLLPLLLIEVYQYLKKDLLAVIKLPYYFRVPIYGLMVIWIVIFHPGAPVEFIYFQF